MHQAACGLLELKRSEGVYVLRVCCVWRLPQPPCVSAATAQRMPPSLAEAGSGFAGWLLLAAHSFPRSLTRWLTHVLLALPPIEGAPFRRWYSEDTPAFHPCGHVALYGATLFWHFPPSPSLRCIACHSCIGRQVLGMPWPMGGIPAAAAAGQACASAKQGMSSSLPRNAAHA